jgi:hypothetical protein
MDLVSLKNEITTDPAAIGYTAVIADHVAVAKLINADKRTIDRSEMTSGELVSCLDKTEFTSLSAPDKAWLNLFVTAQNVPMTADVRQALRSLFPAQSKTRQNINQATRKLASRADELGLGRVTESDVANALREQ